MKEPVLLLPILIRIGLLISRVGLLFAVAAGPSQGKPTEMAIPALCQARGTDPTSHIRLNQEDGHLSVVYGQRKVVVEIDGITRTRTHKATRWRQKDSKVGSPATTILAAGESTSCEVQLDSNGTLKIFPGANKENIHFSMEINALILPGGYLEDVIYDPLQYEDRMQLYLPADRSLVCLLWDGEGVCYIQLPNSSEYVSAYVGIQSGKASFRSLNIHLAHDPISMRIVSSVDSWRKLDSAPLAGSTVASVAWKRPYLSTWKTQLLFSGTRMDFAIREKATQVWWPLHGRFTWPVWYENGNLKLALSKEIKAPREFYVYPLLSEIGQSARSPADSQFSANLIKTWTKVGRFGLVDCWGIDILKRTLIWYGAQKREKKFLHAYVGSYLRYLEEVQHKNQQYSDITDQLLWQVQNWKRSNKGNYAVLEFLGILDRELNEIQEQYRSAISIDGRSMTSEHIEYGRRICSRLDSLIDEPGTEFIPEFYLILDELNMLSGTCEERIPATLDPLFRNLFYEASYHAAGPLRVMSDYCKIVRSTVLLALSDRKWEAWNSAPTFQSPGDLLRANFIHYPLE